MRREWIVFNFIDDYFELVETEEEAEGKAREILECYSRDIPNDKWPEDIEGSIGYAKVRMSTKITKIEKVELVIPV